MTQTQDVAIICVAMRSTNIGFWSGPMFSVIREADCVKVVASKSAFIVKCIGQSAFILYKRSDKYLTDFWAVSEGTSTVLYHEDKVMVSEVTLCPGTENDATYYTIVLDIFTPINNLYVNTESK